VKILLPPSETKAVGGGHPSLAVSPIDDDLQLARKQIIDTLVGVCADQELAKKALKLGPKQIADIQRNLELMDSPTMSAIDRYTGVLYDALKADGAVKGKNIYIQSALFGLIPATTPIPYYRFSWDSKLPGINLKRHWKQAHQVSLSLQSRFWTCGQKAIKNWPQLTVPTAGWSKFLWSMQTESENR